MSADEGKSCGGTIAVIGDLHSAWEVEDVGYFNRSDYPAVLVTGDLGRSRSQDGRGIARSLLQLVPETLVMLGNNDVEESPHIRAELTYRKGRADLLADALPAGTVTPLRSEIARLAGFSLHPLNLNGLQVTVVAARPFSMGGPQLAFPDALERAYGVTTMQKSIERLRELVDAVTTEHVVFLAHNGPTGLGAHPDDIWGRDFHPAAGDWGDPDLRIAIDHALVRGLRVLAVVAGHMHWGLRDHSRDHSLSRRHWQVRSGGILYLNAARVPRIFQSAGGASVRHHVRLTLTSCSATAEEVLVADAACAE